MTSRKKGSKSGSTTRSANWIEPVVKQGNHRADHGSGTMRWYITRTSNHLGTGPISTSAKGLRTKGTRNNLTKGDWVEYSEQSVMAEINSRAGNPDVEPLLAFKWKADTRVRQAQGNLLSIIDIQLNKMSSQFLSERRDSLSRLSTKNQLEVEALLRPQANTTHDLEARQQGWKTPPHIQVRARARAIFSTAEAIRELDELGRQIEFHISRQMRYREEARSEGNRVFLGHGRSSAWRELKDFIEERLGLPVDEFNRVPTAGVSTPNRLTEMMDSSGIAFLVMTGEDEQATGELRPRENVVHEAGLFQGRLGFLRAIVLLEDGCEKFSNNAGLTHINFPKGNIRAAFQDIRETLEREGFLNIGATL